MFLLRSQSQASAVGQFDFSFAYPGGKVNGSQTDSVWPLVRVFIGPAKRDPSKVSRVYPSTSRSLGEVTVRWIFYAVWALAVALAAAALASLWFS